MVRSRGVGDVYNKQLMQYGEFTGGVDKNDGTPKESRTEIDFIKHVCLLNLTRLRPARDLVLEKTEEGQWKSGAYFISAFSEKVLLVTSSRLKISKKKTLPQTPPRFFCRRELERGQGSDTLSRLQTQRVLLHDLLHGIQRLRRAQGGGGEEGAEAQYASEEGARAGHRSKFECC